MSVRDNVLSGGHCRNRSGFIANALRPPIVGREQRLLGGRATVLLEMLELTAVADVPVSAVPFWRLKRVELARALAGEPRLLLLDEPAAGLKELQNLLDELAASRASRRSTWRIVQEWRAILKDAAGVEPPPVVKNISIEGRIIRDGGSQDIGAAEVR